MLQLDSNGTALTESYLNNFTGAGVTYNIFKNALNNAAHSFVEDDPGFEEIVALSGGVDSSILLSLVKNLKDVKTVTFRMVPLIAWSSPDLVRSLRIAKKLEVSHEFIDVDLDEINLESLNKIIMSMPFGAHLSIYFAKMFEALCGQKKRLWCGQDLDNLYNYGLDLDLWIIHRFLLSDMLRKNAERRQRLSALCSGQKDSRCSAGADMRIYL